MFRRFAIVLLVGIAILQAPLTQATAHCCLHLELQQQASFSDGCCAPLSCCVISNDNTVAPIAPAPLPQELSALPASTCLVSLIDFPAGPQVTRFAGVRPVAHSPPPLAVSCIFLI